ncbi:hypothetical protein HPB49_001034 [Dermacentor silvarum]|uniref:Uncharacterized protein n=1 Tax=Dermacentor silvarum TaxID=543639 RepID=A0ACB8DI13_DERSI|nr:hypothetical protein HPB49_001034 [Dermacentor silvarum]
MTRKFGMKCEGEKPPCEIVTFSIDDADSTWFGKRLRVQYCFGRNFLLVFWREHEDASKGCCVLAQLIGEPREVDKLTYRVNLSSRRRPLAHLEGQASLALREHRVGRRQQGLPLLRRPAVRRGREAERRIHRFHLRKRRDRIKSKHYFTTL